MEALCSSDVGAILVNQYKLKELPLFEFQVLAVATDNFSITNKLGQGGFGAVYKVFKQFFVSLVGGIQSDNGVLSGSTFIYRGGYKKGKRSL